MTVVLTNGARRDRSTGRDDDVDIARDRELITRAQAGDRSAFDELYLHYARRLYRLCLRRLSDPHEAEDVAQEAFVRAWRALPRFCGERRFYPWLSVIAANLCTDVLRKRSRSTPVAEFFGADPDTGEELDDRLLHEVDAAMVGEALTKLTERHRRILSLREEAGMTYQAIAEHEGVAVSAVETLLWRARQALKRAFCALAEAAEGRGAALVGLGLVGRLLARVLRMPVRGAKRLAHFTPASAVLTVASISAVGALAIGVTHAAAPSPVPSPVQAALGTHALGGAPGGRGSVSGAPGATVGDEGVASAGTSSAVLGGGDSSVGDAAAHGGSSGPADMPGVTGLEGYGAGSPLFPPGSGAVGSAAVTGAGGSGAGLGGLLGALSSGSPSGGLVAVTDGVTKGVSAAAGAAVGSVGSTLATVTKDAPGATGIVGGVTKGVSVAGGAVAGSAGSTLSTMTKAVSGAAGGTAGGVTKSVSTAGGSAGSTLSSVPQAAAGAPGTAGTVITSVVGGAPTGSNAVSPVLGAGSSSSGSGASGSSMPASPPLPASGGGTPLPPVGIGGLFG